jgi:hypothetical protein
MEKLEELIARFHVFLTLESDGNENSASWPFALPLGVEHQISLGRRLGGSTACLGAVGEREIVWVLWEKEKLSGCCGRKGNGLGAVGEREIVWVLWEKEKLSGWCWQKRKWSECCGRKGNCLGAVGEREIVWVLWEKGKLTGCCGRKRNCLGGEGERGCVGVVGEREIVWMLWEKGKLFLLLERFNSKVLVFLPGDKATC